jgi:hypothetical protein
VEFHNSPTKLGGCVDISMPCSSQVTNYKSDTHYVSPIAMQAINSA